jgi:hypothetical protein
MREVVYEKDGYVSDTPLAMVGERGCSEGRRLEARRSKVQSKGGGVDVTGSEVHPVPSFLENRVAVGVVGECEKETKVWKNPL